MDYEKSYKDALDRAKKWRNAPNSDKIPTYANRVIEEIFPELKESEDERIRKGITDFIKRKFENSCSPTPSKTTLANWIAWLEKQGEQKPSWTEEDDAFMKVMIADLESLKSWGIMNNDVLNNRIKWLKSLKDRCSLKPTEEQIKKTMEE